VRYRNASSYRNNKMVCVYYGCDISQRIYHYMWLDGNDDDVTTPHYFTIIDTSMDPQSLQ